MRRRRENHVGVARRLVQIDVDTHHEVERFERRDKLIAVRCREQRVAADHHHRTNLSGAGGRDFFGHQRGWVLPQRLWEATNASLSAASFEPLADAFLAASRRAGSNGQREHCPAFFIEVAGDHVQHVDEPRRGGAEAHRGGADAAVHRCTVRVAQLDGDSSDGCRVDADLFLHSLGRELCECLVHVFEAVDVTGEVVTGLGTTRLEHRRDHCREQQRVGTRANREPLVR